MSYSDPPRPPRYPALAQYEDSYPSYQETQVDFRTGNDRAPWDGEPRDTAPWDDTLRRSTGGLRAVPDLPRQPTGAMGVLGDIERQPSLADGEPRRSRGLLAGAVAGFLAAGVAIGFGNLTAAFVRPQASPIIAVGEDFINHTPSALKNFAVEKFGENDKTMLLLGMYVTIALLAILIGVLAWRRLVVGVVGIGLFGLFGAYVAITLPASRSTDVIPSVISGIAGIATIVWLIRIGTAPGRRRAAWAGGRFS